MTTTWTLAMSAARSQPSDVTRCRRPPQPDQVVAGLTNLARACVLGDCTPFVIGEIPVTSIPGGRKTLLNRMELTFLRM